MNASLGKMDGALAGAGRSFLGFGAKIAGAYLAVNTFNKSIQRMDQTLDLANRIGDTTEAIGGLQYAAVLSGSTADKMSDSLDRMQKNLGEAASGTGEARDAIAGLGLDINALLAMRPSEAFAQIADRVAGLGSQAEKSAAAAKIFGRGGMELVNVLDLGSEGLREMTEEAKAAGYAFGTEAAKNAAAFDDAMQRLKATAAGFATELASSLAPALEAAAGLLTEMLNTLNKIDNAMGGGGLLTLAGLLAVGTKTGRGLLGGIGGGAAGGAAAGGKLGGVAAGAARLLPAASVGMIAGLGVGELLAGGKERGIERNNASIREQNAIIEARNAEVQKKNIAILERRAQAEEKLTATQARALEATKAIHAEQEAQARGGMTDVMRTQIQRIAEFARMVETPLEKLNRLQGEYSAELQLGNVSLETYRRLLAQANKEFADGRDAITARSGVAAVARGTVEAFSAVQEARRQAEALALEKQQLKELEEANDTFRDGNDILRDIRDGMRVGVSIGP